ncbi:peptidase [bacterium]|nr:peptidase [bacterium]
MQNVRRFVTLSLFIFLTSLIVVAQNPYDPDTPEAGSVQAIARYTTETKFGNPWVAYVPDSSTVPSPTKYLGHVVGAAGELSHTAKIYGYLRELAKASDRVDVEVIGKSEEGRDILLVLVSDGQNIKNLAQLQQATAALADPRKTSPQEAERIIATAKPIYYFNAGLHSTETGSPEMVMEMAYRLAVSEQPHIQEIRRNVVVLINPVSEPDGRDKVVDWFYRYLKGKTDFDNLPRRTPPFWGKYVFHDNNRDTHQHALKLTQAVHKMFYNYHPTVMHDLHESIPLLLIWNGTGPWNPNLDPLVINEAFETALHEMTTLTGFGMPGVWTWGFGEGWGHHYLDSLAMNHNALGRGYETFGNSTAETVARVLRPNQERYVDKPVTEPDWYRPLPPEKKMQWSLRNNTNYMQTGCLAVLSYTAKHGQEMLRNFYRRSYNSWQKGVKGNPYAFVIAPDQGDRRRVAQMVELLRSHKIEVHRATAAIKVKEGEFPKGSYVVRLDQPYRNYTVDLLVPQEFPTDTPYEPYDDIAWAFPVHYGVETKRIDDAAILKVGLEPLPATLVVRGQVKGNGPVFLLKDTGQESLVATRVQLANFKIEIAEQNFKAGGIDYPRGSWIIAGQEGLRQALDRVAEELALDFVSAGNAPDVKRHDSPLPRIGLWTIWADTEMAGWVRMTLDQQKIPYTYLRDEEIRAGKLRDQFDLIIYPENYQDLKTQIHGIDTKFGPMPYTKTAQFTHHGVPVASNDITGGIGWKGIANLADFLEQGGLLVTLGNGSALPLEGGLVRNVRRGSEVTSPGVEIGTKFIRYDHPLAYGYPETTSVFRQSYQVYSVRPADRRWIVMQWGTRLPKPEREVEKEDQKEKKDEKKEEEAPMVVSGGMKSTDDLEGHAAILDLPAGRGRVIAFNFNPMHRDLNHSDYRLLWNVILNWSSLPPAVP